MRPERNVGSTKRVRSSLQALLMVWDYAEANMLGKAVGAWSTCSEYVSDCVKVLSVGNKLIGKAHQVDAAMGLDGISNLLVNTDPTYYDNIGYATLSDFFDVWLRRTIGDLYPEHFGTVFVPKMPELTASPRSLRRRQAQSQRAF